MKHFLCHLGFARRTAERQAARDLAEARLALLETTKLREYYTAVEAMLVRRIARLEKEARHG